LKPLRYNSPDCPVCTGLSGEPRSNGYFRANGYLQSHSMRASGAQSSGAPILVHRTVNSSCPVCTGHPGGPTSQKLQRSKSNGSDDVAGAPDCPVCTGLSGAPSNRQPLQTASFCLVAINTTPTGHFKGGSSSNIPSHLVDILKPSQPPIFIDTSYTQDLAHYNQHKCHKRKSEQLRATQLSLALVPCEIH
jgi:hypothetical protein